MLKPYTLWVTSISMAIALLIGKFYKKAIDYYSKAAAKGDANAQRQLSVCLYNGIGGTQSYRDAFNWLSRSVNADPTPVTEK